ncbi:MAG: DNA polymerase III subunit delta' [Xanthomonadales bacterium]|nr:DNA polymerase III subunit delta' [Xanthomonadales bacterium]
MTAAVVYPWHAEAWHTLQQRAERGQLPHALLIDGERGLGKRVFAERLLHGRLCQQPLDGVACGQCKACGLLAAGTHPDYVHVTFELNREGKPRSEIVVDQMRLLAQRLSMASQFGGWQVVTIDPADGMNNAAANALLKTLEEPSAQSLLLLISDASWRLPATIRSRCQRITLARPSMQQAQAWLSAQGIDAATADKALDASGGNPGLALDLSEAGAMPRRDEVVRDLAALRSARTDAYSVAIRWAADEPRQRLWFAARELHRHAAASAEHFDAQLLERDGEAFTRINRARELLRGPLRPELVLVDVLASLSPKDARA